MPKQIKKFEKTLYNVTLLQTFFEKRDDNKIHQYNQPIKRIAFIRDDDNISIYSGVYINSYNLLVKRDHFVDEFENISFHELILLDKEKFQSSIPASCNNDCN